MKLTTLSFSSIVAATVASLMLMFAAPVKAQTPEQIETIRGFVQLMQDYYSLIKSVHAISDNAEAAAILQMFKIEEIYEERGEKARAVDIFKEVLANSENPTIRNAAVMMLGETLKETNRSDEALDVLRQGLLENIQNAD
ncbi:MAG: hypothetical protein AAF438_14075 [Pseudomonadota bacterium]